MHKETWKKLERRIAALFGSERNRLSGSSGRDVESKSDSLHERLFIECKAKGGRYALITLWEKTAKLARKEGKLPVVAIHSTLQDGDYLLVRADHLAAVASEIDNRIAGGE